MSYLRWGVIACVLIASMVLVFPLSERVKLGLDLQGGVHLVLGIGVDQAVESKLETRVEQIIDDFRSEKISYSFVRKESPTSLRIGFKNEDDKKAIEDIMSSNYPNMKKGLLGGSALALNYSFDNSYISKIKNDAVERSLEIVRNRVDKYGATEPLIQRQGSDQVLVQLPGVTDPDRAIDLIGQTAQLTFHIVDSSVSSSDISYGRLPNDSVVMYQRIVDNVTGQEIDKVPFVVKKNPVLSGEYVEDAYSTIDTMTNRPVVAIRFDRVGTKLFSEVSKNYLHQRLAIILDGNIYSAPYLNTHITSGRAQIEGNFTDAEAHDLAIVLTSGSLPAPVTIEENRTVGPSLGQDSIDKGVLAATVGLFLVLMFMIYYYKFCGILANIALLMNFAIILGLLSLVDATLTLPGIAGIILTVGISVDANVLIFERIREELRLGRSAFNAIELGYEKALRTILDANITTLIAAVVLYNFGTGPIKGFAITLSFGVIASMFTAIFVTKTIFLTLLEKKIIKKISI